MGRQSLDILATLGKGSQVPWEDKIEKVFWRGRDSRRERLKLVEMGQKHPDKINASITAYFFFRDEEARLGKSPYVNFFDFFNHKYQLNIDGTVAAYRLPYLLAGGSLVFKQESSYFEHFYSGLKPWVHYVPVKEDLEDLLEKLEWAKKNDQEAKQIAEAGQMFARRELLPVNVLCYYAEFLVRWSKLVNMKTTVEVGEDMEQVGAEKAESRFPACNCEARNKLFKDEL